MNNSKYTEDQIVIEQARQLEEEGFRFYSPHAAQVDFHKSPAKIRALLGGNRSGKSFGGTIEICYTVGKCHPFRRNHVGKVMARDCCVDFGTIRAALLPTYQKILPRRPCKLGWDTYEGKPAMWPGLRGGTWRSAWREQEKVLYLEDGSFVEFKTYEQGRESMQGAERHIIRHDEEPPEPIYIENLTRQATLGTNILFTLTPLNYSQWLYQQIYQMAAKDDKVAAFKMSVYDNPHIDAEAVQMIEEQCSDPAIKAARLFGEFTFLEGRVYKEYGEHNLVTPFNIPDFWHKTIVIDPHLSKPTAVNLFADNPSTGVTYCVAEGDFDGDVQSICAQIWAMCGDRTIHEWLVDPSSRQETKIHGKGRLIDEFRKYLPDLLSANNNRELGWDAVRSAVKKRPNGAKARTFKSCPVTHHQMLNYMWKAPLKSGEDRNKPEVHKRQDDHCDNYRYKMMSKPRSRRTSKEFRGFGITAVS